MKTPEKQYMESKVLTATPEQLLIMLFDGAIRFAGQARVMLEERNPAAAGPLLIRAQNIALELISSVKVEDVGEQLCRNLHALYRFVHSRLVNANMKRDPGAIDEALHILRHLRETWAMSIENGRAQQSGELAAAVQAVAAAVPGRANPNGVDFVG